MFVMIIPFSSFNTQPPEGGWDRFIYHPLNRRQFQHTAARRRLATLNEELTVIGTFQHTAARRRLAEKVTVIGANAMVSTHSRPKAAGHCRAIGLLQ